MPAPEATTNTRTTPSAAAQAQAGHRNKQYHTTTARGPGTQHMKKVGHRRQRTQTDRKTNATRKSLLKTQGDLYEEIDKNIRARTIAQTHILIDKLHPMTRKVFGQDIEHQRARLRQQENNPPGARPPPEPPPAPERTWFPCP